METQQEPEMRGIDGGNGQARQKETTTKRLSAPVAAASAQSEEEKRQHARHLLMGVNTLVLQRERERIVMRGYKAHILLCWPHRWCGEQKQRRLSCVRLLEIMHKYWRECTMPGE